MKTMQLEDNLDPVLADTILVSTWTICTFKQCKQC